MTDRLAILEAALDVGLGRRYGHTGDDQTDCVQFAEAILIRAFPDVDWAPLHSAMMIGAVADLFSNVDALIGVGFPETQAPAAGAFSYCQGWRSLRPLRGHCFLWWQPAAPSVSASMILEATNATADWYRPAQWPDMAAKYPAGLRMVTLCAR